MGSVTHIPVTGRKINSTDYHEEHLLDLDTTDITDALGYVPVNKAGDTMTGNLFVRGNELQVGPLIGSAQDGLITINNTKTYSGFWLKSRDTAGGSELLDGLITSFRGYGLILSGDPALSLRIGGDEIAQISSTGMNIATGKVLTVPDEAYGPAWNGKTEVPTKNAVYDAVAANSLATVYAKNTSSLNGTPSTSAFASKGHVIKPLYPVTIVSVWLGMTPVDAATYIIGLYPVGADLTIDAVTAVTTPRTGLGAINGLFRFDFAAPVNLTAGTRYVLAFTRTDSTTTYILPLNSSSVNAHLVGLPFSVESNTVRLADISPGIGDTFVDTGSASSYEFALVGNFTP